MGENEVLSIFFYSFCMMLVLLIGLFLVSSSNGKSPETKKLVESSQYGTYDFTGRDFFDTQLIKRCLLARLNVSITLAYRAESIVTKEEFFIPTKVNNSGSVCDYEFESRLQLHFEGVSFTMQFNRNAIVRDDSIELAYCEGCNTGYWSLTSLQINVKNTSVFVPEAPSCLLKSYMKGDQISSAAGRLSSGVDLQRGYRCKQLLKGILNVTEVDFLMNDSNRGDWEVSVRFHYVDIQPFLVQKDGNVKDPLLCSDVTLSLILIVIVPILYFAIFIAFYRIKDTYGCPVRFRQILKNRHQLKNDEKFGVSKTIPQDCLELKALQKTQKANVVVTFTSPDNESTQVLTHHAEEPHSSHQNQ